MLHVRFVPKADIPHCGKKRRYFSPTNRLNKESLPLSAARLQKEGLKIKDSCSPK